MSEQKYFVIDIETSPVMSFDDYSKLLAEDQLKLLNPIDSKLVAAGLRHNGKNYLFLNDRNNEKQALELFWAKWKEIKPQADLTQVAGFNITQFDIPFLLTRSFIHNVRVPGFTLKSVMDIREKLSAGRYGHKRGKLKEIATLIGLDILDTDGSDMPRLYANGDWKQITTYLEKDLEITDQMFKRLEETGIMNISRW